MKYKATVHSMLVQRPDDSAILPSEAPFNAMLLLTLTEPLTGIDLNEISGTKVEFEILEG